jgi:hypothetical protein
MLCWKLVELPKVDMAVGSKIFKREEGILRVEEVKVNLVGLQRTIKCKRKNQIGKLISLTMNFGFKWRLVSRSRFKCDLNLIHCLE